MCRMKTGTSDLIVHRRREKVIIWFGCEVYDSEVETREYEKSQQEVEIFVIFLLKMSPSLAFNLIVHSWIELQLLVWSFSRSLSP